MTNSLDYPRNVRLEAQILTLKTTQKGENMTLRKLHQCNTLIRMYDIFECRFDISNTNSA